MLSLPLEYSSPIAAVDSMGAAEIVSRIFCATIHRRIFYINTVPVMDIIVFMYSSSNIAQKSSQSAV